MKKFLLFAALSVVLGSISLPCRAQGTPRGSGNQAWLMNEVRHQLVLLPY
jgi:hypothetical protein